MFDVGGVLLRDKSLTIDGASSRFVPVPLVAKGAEEALRVLRDSGYSLATLSNVDRKDDRTGELPQLFANIHRTFSSHATGWRKPAREAFLHVQAVIQADAINICMVGDRYNADIKPALSLGWSAIWLSPPRKEPSGSLNTSRLRIVTSISAVPLAVFELFRDLGHLESPRTTC